MQLSTRLIRSNPRRVWLSDGLTHLLQCGQSVAAFAAHTIDYYGDGDAPEGYAFQS